ncbi:putative signal peptidase I [Dioscorea sansibarensis]
MAWGSGTARRFAGIPWRMIASDAAARFMLVCKAACAVHVFNNYVCSIALVRGPSMLPAINVSGDVVAVERISVRSGTVGVGDVVLLRSPENPLKIVTKRVTGLEGDSVTFERDPARGDHRRKTVLVPKGHVWVQGDNIYESRDSRQFGPVPYGLIQGRAFCKLWPPKDFGYIEQKL